MPDAHAWLRAGWLINLGLLVFNLLPIADKTAPPAQLSVSGPHGLGQYQELVLTVEQRQLTAVARRELPHGERGSFGQDGVRHNSRCVKRRDTRPA